jgi:hypothetical protein
MRTGTVKQGLQLFRIVAVGTSVFGIWQDYRIGETLIAAVILSAFVVGIAWAGERMDRFMTRRRFPPPLRQTIIHLARDDDVLPAFRRRCLFAKGVPVRQTVHSVGMIGTTARE